MSEQDRRRIVALQEDNIKLIDEAERSRAEAARYRAALEALCDASSWGMGVDPKRVSCRWCGALWPGDHHAICPKAIAHRALHPEEEEER